MIHFLKNVMMAGGLLQIAAFGAGAFSIDNQRKAGGIGSSLGGPPDHPPRRSHSQFRP